jgi:hypothetical protein
MLNAFRFNDTKQNLQATRVGVNVIALNFKQHKLVNLKPWHTEHLNAARNNQTNSSYALHIFKRKIFKCPCRKKNFKLSN